MFLPSTPMAGCILLMSVIIHYGVILLTHVETRLSHLFVMLMVNQFDRNRQENSGR